MNKPRLREEPPNTNFRFGEGVEYTTGAAFGAGFWLVFAVPCAIVGSSTSGVLSDVFWGVAALFALLVVVNFAFYVSGHNGGTNGRWVKISPPKKHP